MRSVQPKTAAGKFSLLKKLSLESCGHIAIFLLEIRQKANNWPRGDRLWPSNGVISRYDKACKTDPVRA
jgi:hypothetical protein